MTDAIDSNVAEERLLSVQDFMKNRKLMMDMSWPFDTCADSGYTTIDGDVAIIHVQGVLVKKSEFFADFCQTSYEEIEREIVSAIINPAVNKIVLDIDSPGGDVNGLFELCEYIKLCRLQKKFIAFANDSAFSAAYALASCCDEIYCTSTGGVGSIGVICQHVDFSKAEKDAGIKVTSIKKKNDLSPHEPLSEEAAAARRWLCPRQI